MAQNDQHRIIRKREESEDKKLKRDVIDAAKEGNLRKLKVLLDQKPELVSATAYGATPLLMSCRNGHMEVVKYLLDKCGAPMEQTGLFYFDRLGVRGVPPLWCAARAGHLSIVKMLVEKGANVNSTTSYGHTCLMVVCSKGYLKTAKYLIERGADVNRKTDKGITALHECAESGHFGIMKLLLLSGARLDVDAKGMTPLMVASDKGHQQIVEHLISQRELVTKQEKIDALELLGAIFINNENLDLALKLWKQATEERYEDGVLVIPKIHMKCPISGYNNMLEFETVMEPELMVSEPDFLWMQALLVRERILSYSWTCFHIWHRGIRYKNSGNFSRCINLWLLYALNILHKYNKTDVLISFFCQFIRLFYIDMTDGQLRENFSDIMMVFRKMVMELQASQDAPRAGELEDVPIDGDPFRVTIIFVLFLVCRLTDIMPDLEEEKIHEIKKVVHLFVTVGAQGRCGVSVLHLACSWDMNMFISQGSNLFNRDFPSLATINLLLECGAPVDTKDNDGNTALHQAALKANAGSIIRNKRIIRTSNRQPVIQSLLKYGAHFDLVNNQKKTFYELLDGSLLHEIIYSEINSRSRLACLAAQVARKHNLALDSLPLKLKDFVLNH